MPYVTADEVETAVRGPARLYGVLLEGHGENETTHPHLDSLILATSNEADRRLRNAGVSVPLTALTGASDPLFKSAVIGLLVGMASLDMSNREQWMEDLSDAADAYFANVALGDLPTGAEEDTDALSDQFIRVDGIGDDPLFDGPRSGAAHVFGDLGGSPFRNRW